MTRNAIILAGLLLVSMLLIGAAKTEHFVATVLLPDTVRTSTTGPTAQIDIGIEGYTSDKQMEELGAIFGDGNNQTALLNKIYSMKRVGWVSRPGHIGVDVKIIRVRKVANGREFTMLTDRNIGFWEAMNSPATKDYPFGMLRMTVDDKGQGQGKIDIIGKVRKIGPGGIEIDNYGVIPWDITSIKKSN